VRLVSFEFCALIFWIFENTIIWICRYLRLDLKLWNFDRSILWLIIGVDQAAKFSNSLLRQLDWRLFTLCRWGIGLNIVLLHVISIQAWFSPCGTHRLNMTFALFSVYLTSMDHRSLRLHNHMRPIFLSWLYQSTVGAIKNIFIALWILMAQNLRGSYILSWLFRVNFAILTHIMLSLILILSMYLLF
jgi:hypothetical protein